MWNYYLDDNTIEQCVVNRMKFPNSEKIATAFLSSLGYDEEYMRLVPFEDVVFLEGAMDEVYTQAEIKECEKLGKIFVSTGKDIFNFFLIDIDNEEQYDAVKIGTIIKIINKAFKGGNIIIFQCNDKFIFGSRYVSKFASRDFHFTYWISSADVLKKFISYNLCKKNQKYSYAMYMTCVCQLSLFKYRWWSDIKDEAEELSTNFIELSKSLSYIVSKQIDSFELLEKAIKTLEFIRTDAKLEKYREADVYEEDDFEMYDDPSMLFNYLKE